MPGYPSDFKYLTESSVKEIPTKPLCPFCGILLQRSQPDFLLSASPAQAFIHLYIYVAVHGEGFFLYHSRRAES
uniref:Uncharacterized protein n=1 Tax=Populus trichocarpa TaxID=3694 RepID=A0A2K1XFZ1_POPTR